MSRSKPACLLSATEEAIKQVLEDGQWDIREFKTEQEFESSFETISDSDFDLIVCGDLLGPSFPNEFAQILRQQCPNTPIYYITTKKDGFQAAIFKKNGFTDSFIWPAGSPLFKEKVQEAHRAYDPTKRTFKGVSLVDVDGKSELPFSTFVHLQLNKKYLKISNAKEPLGESKLKKLTEHDVGKVFIDKKDSQEFYSYTASRLKSLGKSDGSLSETERSERLQESVRTIFNDILDQSANTDFSGGKEMLANCQKIISNYITGGTSNNWYSQLVLAMGGAANSYDHAATVSSVAALIALGLGTSAPEDLAMAGFFHDLGRIDFPEELIQQPESEWPPEMKELYQKHPQASVNMLKQKKMLISKDVETAILQHHEKYNGKGFPKQLTGERISEAGQILSFADQFFYLTLGEDNKKRLKPQEALAQIAANGSLGPGLITRIKKLLGLN